MNMRFLTLIATLTLPFVVNAKGWERVNEKGWGDNDPGVFRLQYLKKEADNSPYVLSEMCFHPGGAVRYPLFSVEDECKRAPLIPVTLSQASSWQEDPGFVVRLKTIDPEGRISTVCLWRSTLTVENYPSCQKAPIFDKSVQNGPGNPDDYEMRDGQCYTKSEGALVSTFRCKTGVERIGNPFVYQMVDGKCLNGRNEEVILDACQLGGGGGGGSASSSPVGIVPRSTSILPVKPENYNSEVSPSR